MLCHSFSLTTDFFYKVKKRKNLNIIFVQRQIFSSLSKRIHTHGAGSPGTVQLGRELEDLRAAQFYFCFTTTIGPAPGQYGPKTTMTSSLLKRELEESVCCTVLFLLVIKRTPLTGHGVE